MMLAARTAAVSALLCLLLAACATAPHYTNSANPAAGASEFSQDNERCRRENAHTTTASGGGYAEVAHTEVDEDKVQACLAARGWHPASN
jgi:hypothetical protein